MTFNWEHTYYKVRRPPKLTAIPGSKKYTTSRIGQARVATKQLSSLLWSNRITKNDKIIMYKPIVESIELYGADLWKLWNLTRKTRQKLKQSRWTIGDAAADLQEWIKLEIRTYLTRQELT